MGGLGTLPTPPGTGDVPFRIDHDENFNETTQVQYQLWAHGPWLCFNWRYDSGLVAGASLCYGIGATNNCPQSVLLGGQPAVMTVDPTGIPFSADQEFEAGFTCNGVHACHANHAATVHMPRFGIRVYAAQRAGAGNGKRGQESARVAARSLFDLAIGDDTLFHGDRYRWSARLTVINLTNKYALYNCLSRSSGTHYVTPRTITGQIGFHF